MKYIDADKLLAEIERLTNQKKEKLKRFSDEDYTCSVASSINCKLCGNEEVLSIITSLQQEQPEVDLDREIIKYKVPFADEREYLNETTLDTIARHFFELGLSAGMEKSNGVDGVVHHALKSHWIVTDKNKLAAILKAFPEGAEVELFICAKKEK